MKIEQRRYPKTTAIHHLNRYKIEYEVFYYEQKEEGSAAFTASVLGVDLSDIVKSILFIDEEKRGVIALMRGDYHINSKKLAEQLGRKRLVPAPFEYAHRWTGYQFGGTSPFGIRAELPIAVERSLMEKPYLYINGGKRGLILKIHPDALKILDPIYVEVGEAN